VGDALRRGTDDRGPVPRQKSGGQASDADVLAVLAPDATVIDAFFDLADPVNCPQPHPTIPGHPTLAK
jgi:hypothetical protein